MLSDHMLRQMVDAMPMPVFVTNESDHFVYANRAFETLFQVRAASLVQQGAASVLSQTAPGQLVESTTFSTPSGDELTMSLIHTEAFAAKRDAELDAAHAELREARAELARMRETDPVTQALSRRALRAHTEDAFAIFARIDESDFVLVLREADREQTAAVARRICAAVTDARTTDGHAELALSITVGAAYSDDIDTQLAALITEAEQALRSASPCRNEAVVA